MPDIKADPIDLAIDVIQKGHWPDGKEAGPDERLVLLQYLYFLL